MRLANRALFTALTLIVAGSWVAAPLTGCSSDDSEAEPGPSTDAGADSDATADGADGATEGAPPGSACWVDADCKDGVCWTPKDDGMPGGYCVIEGCTDTSCPTGSSCVSFNDGVNRCAKACAADADCREAEGYVCGDKSVCWPGEGLIAPGGSCGADEQCMGGDDALCIQQPGWVGGYCMINCTNGTCPEGSECRQILTNNGSACVPVYSEAGSCRPGYKWVEDSESKYFHSCYPGCDDDAGCPGDFGCREGTKGLVCLDVSHECSAKNHQGDCPAGEVCTQGTCAPFVCNDTVMEPNDTQAAAKAWPTTSTQGLQICYGDQDWFEITPSEAKTIYLVGVDSNIASGNLQVELQDAAGAVAGDATMDPKFYHSEGSVGPTNLEIHSLIGVPGSAKSFLKVFGKNGAENNYGTFFKTVTWDDGPSCTTIFGAAECASANSAGNHDPSKLIVFPAMNPLDPYIGDGVFFKNGLSAFGNPPYTSTSRLWARREVIMAVRHAIHSVQQTFPGTKPLSIGDIGMPDGTTPEGHPNGTHYYGANVDIAYYIRPEVQGEHGNLSYRQICCDAPLSDWGCVDTNTSSPDYGVCKDGSETTHIVDLPRTAMFIAKLAGTGRIRVIGVEAKVEKPLEDEMDAQVGKGQLTSLEAAAGKASMMTANDDGSWIWHFNHMHASFVTKPALTSSGQGLWPDLPDAEQAALARAFPRKVPDPKSKTGYAIKVGAPIAH